MPEGGSLINLGGLSEPATVLIKKVSAAIGVLYEPRRIRKRAEAEAEAEKIAALARIEITDLERRGLERMVHQEARKQENIESITAQAVNELPANANVEALEEDWVAHFFKQCDTVSDRDMQSLWAKLLAGEATKPGTFSKRTVDFISTIDKKDAALFTTFCQFVWHVGDLLPLIYDVNDAVYTTHGIHFSSLKHLDSIGLISFESVSGYARQKIPKYASVFYYGRPVTMEFREDADNVLPLGHALLTTTGKELAPICGSSRNEEFYQYVVKKWFTDGLVLSSPVAPRQ